MSAWASFHRWVAPYVRGCPQPLINQALCDTARDFCTRTRAWVDEAAAVISDGSTDVIAFVFPTGAELVRVERVTVDGIDWDIQSADALPADWQESDYARSLDDTLVVIDRTEYLLSTLPASGDAIVLYQAVRPIHGATGVGDVIFEEWGEQLAQGAKARLKAMTTSAWFDGPGSDLAERAYERAVHSAANRKFRQTRHLRTKNIPC